jgi:hypothetical protein
VLKKLVDEQDLEETLVMVEPSCWTRMIASRWLNRIQFGTYPYLKCWPPPQSLGGPRILTMSSVVEFAVISRIPEFTKICAVN